MVDHHQAVVGRCRIERGEGNGGGGRGAKKVRRVSNCGDIGVGR